jgi:hypothetical protein
LRAIFFQILYPLWVEDFLLYKGINFNLNSVKVPCGIKSGMWEVIDLEVKNCASAIMSVKIESSDNIVTARSSQSRFQKRVIYGQLRYRSCYGALPYYAAFGRQSRGKKCLASHTQGNEARGARPARRI